MGSVMAHDKAPSGTGTLAPERSRRGARASEPVEIIEQLSDAVAEMHRSLSLDAVLRVAADRARSILHAHQAMAVQLLDGDWERAVHAVSRSRQSMARGDDPVPDGRGAYGRVCRTNQPLRLGRSERARAGGSSRQPAARSRSDGSLRGGWLAAPLTGPDGQNLGLLQVADRTDGRDFTIADEAILVQLARMASVAVENARLYEGAVDARSQLTWAAHVERLRAAELRAVIAAMGEAVCVCDVQGRVTLTNPAADALFDGNSPSTYQELLERFEPAAEDGNTDPNSAAVELRHRARPDRWVELRVYPVPADQGRPGSGIEPAGHIAVMRDVTSGRRARAAQDAFVGILSHELRTPITTIYAGARLLARGEPLSRATRQDLAADVGAEAERLFRLVEDLLVMARAERGAIDVAREPVLVQRIVTEALTLEKARWLNQEFVLESPERVPAAAGDATAVEQVVRNLLSNAAKYGANGGKVEIVIAAHDHEVQVRVLDQGTGFHHTEGNELFELFYRSPKTASRAAGAGIGLFVCRQLVEAMGGRIWAKPRQPQGAEFGFALAIYRDRA
jgi:signal transduction histidine kinase